MTATWGPGFDAEIGYRLERAGAAFGRRSGGRVLSDARNPHPRRRRPRRSIGSD